MAETKLSRNEVGIRGEALYTQHIRAKVETPENIGKMVVIDVETGEYGVDLLGLESARHLQEKRPAAPLYGKRIGYDVSVEMVSIELGEIAERRAP